MEYKISNFKYESIDFMKFICSIMVIAIHTSPLENISNDLNYILINSICRIAVPFFFIASGYFLWNKLSIIDKKIRKREVNNYIKKFLIYMYYGLLYI